MSRWFAATAAALVVLTGCSSGSGDGGSTTGAAVRDREPDLSRFEPSDDNRDPSLRIDDLEAQYYEQGLHTLTPTQRVAYDKAPPFGGAHAAVWADCQGTVYDRPVRTEHMVHSLEHGTVWIAYNADDVRGDDLDVLVRKVEGQPYMMLSPYPGLDRPISLQAWDHQLKLDDVDDERIDQFIAALRENPYTTPEAGARCDSQGTGFDVTDPPAFEYGPPGPDAMPVDGS